MVRTADPNTIVLIHGFWVTPRSWEHWAERYRTKGFTVLTPPYPGFEVEVEALNADPAPVVALTLARIVDHLEAIVRRVEQPPILMGHSAGGAITQILLDRGVGAVGVTLNSAPTEGVRTAPRSQLRATFPILRNPANRHRAVGLSYEQWRYAFTNTVPEVESRRLYERYHVPASGRILFDSVLANYRPGRHDASVDYHNDQRPPLLFISGGEDNLMPPAIQRSNAKHYKSDAVTTEVRVYDGFAHLLPAQAGWERIADDALAWALRHARRDQLAAAGR